MRVINPGTQQPIRAKTEGQAGQLPVQPRGAGELRGEEAELLPTDDLLASQFQGEPSVRSIEEFGFESFTTTVRGSGVSIASISS